MLLSVGMIGAGLLAIRPWRVQRRMLWRRLSEWPIRLQRKPTEASRIYGTLCMAALLGVALDFTSINPIGALFWSAVINGVVAVRSCLS